MVKKTLSTKAVTADKEFKDQREIISIKLKAFKSFLTFTFWNKDFLNIENETTVKTKMHLATKVNHHSGIPTIACSLVFFKGFISQRCFWDYTFWSTLNDLKVK